MNNKNKCPSLYEDIFSNPLFIEHCILIAYLLIFLIGLIGNIMTIVIIKYNTQLRTPTNFYLLNLAVSDLMMLMCNLPLEMLEIYHRQWPLSNIFCKLRNICAEFFTCSSILTILAFTCERYFAIVHPVHLHRLSHFRRAQNIIIIIWFISLGFSLPLGLSYEVETNSSILTSPIITENLSTVILLNNNNTRLNNFNHGCKSCVPKKNLAKILSIIIMISSFCLFYFPMFIIGAVYLYIGKALRRLSKYEGYSKPIELSISSQSSLSNREALEMQQQGSQINSYSWLKIRARYQAREVVIKTLVAVVIAFFVCYAPLYLQRLILAIITLNSNLYADSSFLANFLAYLYVISGITFYFGSAINPILYNVVSNKYRRAFRDLFCCRLIINRKTLSKKPSKTFQRTPLQIPHKQENIQMNQRQFTTNPNPHQTSNNIKTNVFTFKTNSLSINSLGKKNKHFISY